MTRANRPARPPGRSLAGWLTSFRFIPAKEDPEVHALVYLRPSQYSSFVLQIPRRAAVGRAIDAALVARRPDLSLYAGIGNIGIRRMNLDP